MCGCFLIIKVLKRQKNNDIMFTVIILKTNYETISKDGVLKYLKQPIEVSFFNELDSTNIEADRQILSGLKADKLIIAKKQTAGRGRLGRSFSSENGGVYFSLVLNKPFEVFDAVFVTTAASCAVVKAIEELTDYKVQIKWVNDIILNGKKLCGILCEGKTDPSSGKITGVVIGIGINTSQNIPKELCDIATFMDLKAKNVSKNQLIAKIVDYIYEMNDKTERANCIDFYKSHSFVLGKEIYYFENNIRHFASCIDIDENGGLIILENGKKKTLSSGEITLRVR